MTETPGHEFWHSKWQTNQIGFHEQAVHPLLKRYWASLAVAAPGRVFVPLCGKSNDMLWLRELGHEIVGVELSEIAVQAFFAENALVATRDELGSFSRYRACGFTLLCGDFFTLRPGCIGPFAAVYDRAALIALAPDARRAYVQHLRALCTAGTSALLITLQYAPGALKGPPFAVADPEVAALYTPWCTLSRLGSGDATVKDVACRETAHQILVAGSDA